MPIRIKGRVYYRTKEACQKSGISRATFYRWLNEGVIKNPSIRDRNGYRLFGEKDIAAIRAEVFRVNRDY